MTPLDTETRATIRLLFGAVCISFSAVFVKVLSVPPAVSAFYRLLFGGGFLLLYILATKRLLSKALTGLLAIFLAAAFFAADLWTWHRSIIYVGPGLATILANFQVFFLALAGVLFFGERWRWQLIVAIPMALLGLGMIVGFDWRMLTEQYRTGIWLGLLTAAFYAAFILSLRRTRTDGRQRSAVVDLALVSLFSAALLGIGATAAGDSLALSWSRDLGILLAYALVAQVFGWLPDRSIIYVGPGLATILANFQVFFLALAGVLFFGERWRWQLIVAIPMALLGLGMIVGFDWRMLTEQYRTGIWLGLLTAAFYAAFILSLRRTRTDGRQRSAVVDLALVSLFSAALLGIGATAAGDSLALSWSRDLGILLAYALVAQVFGWLLIAHSLAQVPASRVGLILLLQPLLAFVWDVLFFSRSIAPTELTGAVLTLLGIYLGMRKAPGAA